tara:strand:+ start:6857 stop:7225 length:369 start_codon:yes stop_codon:yes gene_type:complete
MKNIIWNASLIKKIFFFLNLPFIGIVAIYTLATHTNPMESFLFGTAIILCTPYLVILTDELRDKNFKSLIEDFSLMNDTDLLKFKKQFAFIPLGYYRSLVKQAYTEELKRRFGDSVDAHDLF